MKSKDTSTALSACTFYTAISKSETVQLPPLQIQGNVFPITPSTPLINLRPAQWRYFTYVTSLYTCFYFARVYFSRNGGESLQLRAEIKHLETRGRLEKKKKMSAPKISSFISPRPLLVAHKRSLSCYARILPRHRARNRQVQSVTMHVAGDGTDTFAMYQILAVRAG